MSAVSSTGDNFLVSGDKFRFKKEIQRTGNFNMDFAFDQHSQIKVIGVIIVTSYLAWAREQRV